MYLILSYIIFSDINECQSRNGGCEHHCTNTHGSYRCTCRDGFKLRSDNHACDSKSTNIFHLVLYCFFFFKSAESQLPLWKSPLRYMLKVKGTNSSVTGIFQDNCFNVTGLVMPWPHFFAGESATMISIIWDRYVPLPQFYDSGIKLVVSLFIIWTGILN